MSKHFRVPERMVIKLKEHGQHMPTFLRRSGLPETLLDKPRPTLSTEEFFAVWRTIGETSSDPAIGLLIGTESKREHFDPIALAALSTSTFGEAVRQMSRHKQLTCPEEIAEKFVEDEWSIQFHWTLSVNNEPAVLTDLCFAWVLCIARHGTGTQIAPLRIDLAQPRKYTKAFERHFGCHINYSAGRNAMVFRASDAKIPFVTQNAELLAMLAPQLDEELKNRLGEQAFPDRVRSTIQKKLAGRRPKMQEIARELRVSSRTLQRNLQDSGSSFQQLLEQARHQLARHYLTNPMLELNETAYLLGYEDSGSFVRAFRLWEGVPPGHWRESQVRQAN